MIGRMSDIVSALLQGIDHQRRGETDCAEAIYADVLEREPEHSSALYLYGLLQLKDGRAAGAVQLLQRAAHQRRGIVAAAAS